MFVYFLFVAKCCFQCQDVTVPAPDYWSDHRSHSDIVNLRTQKNIENAYHNFCLKG